MKKKQERMFIDTKELSTMLNIAPKTVIKHRKNIVGAIKIGSLWRFNKAVIMQTISDNKPIIKKNV